MYLQITLLGNRIPANVTLEWFHPGVDEHVSGETTSLSEGLAADFAYVWLLACVEQLVIAQT